MNEENQIKNSQNVQESKASEGLKALERQIQETEVKLNALKEEYSNKTGHVPPQKLTEHSRKWTIFMVLGFAFISSMFYLLCIRYDYDEVTTLIPEVFFDTGFMYFAIVSFYLIIALLVIQPDKMGNYQTLALFLGFWCAHWLIYDWAWWAIRGGFNDLGPAFWQDTFGFGALVPDPPMWLFLTEALLGGIMALYTFTVPDGFKKLVPPFVWLFAIYGNSTLGSVLNLPVIGIYIIGIAIVAIAFGLAGVFAYKRIKQHGLPVWISSFKSFKEQLSIQNWTLNPLGVPGVLIISIALITMHAFLATIPVIGFFIGIIAWYYIPFFYVLYKGSNADKYSKRGKIASALFWIGFIALLMFLFSMI